jgi:hypothetical protein
MGRGKSKDRLNSVNQSLNNSISQEDRMTLFEAATNLLEQKRANGADTNAGAYLQWFGKECSAWAWLAKELARGRSESVAECDELLRQVLGGNLVGILPDEFLRNKEINRYLVRGKFIN